MAALAAVATIGWLLARGVRGERADDVLRAAGAAPAHSAQPVARAEPSPPAAHVRPQREQQAPPRPLPAAGSPLSRTYDELLTRARAGDAAAAARLFDDVRRCFSARERLRSLRAQASLLGDAPAGFTAQQLERRAQELAAIQQELRETDESAAECSELSDEQARVPPVALTAALLGDKTASDCYVRGEMLFADGILNHPEWLRQYAANALQIANAALAAGDWDMVAELQRAYAPAGFRSGPLADLIEPDAEMSYRLLRLQRLARGAGTAADGLDGNLALAAQELSGDAIGRADAWAQEMFVKYFSSSPYRPDDGRTACD